MKLFFRKLANVKSCLHHDVLFFCSQSTKWELFAFGLQSFFAKTSTSSVIAFNGLEQERVSYGLLFRRSGENLNAIFMLSFVRNLLLETAVETDPVVNKEKGRQLNLSSLLSTCSEVNLCANRVFVRR